MSRTLHGYIMIITLLLILSACENDMEVVNKITSKKEVSAEAGKDIEVLYSDLGKVKAKLNAPTMLRFRTKEPYKELPDGLKIAF